MDEARFHTLIQRVRSGDEEAARELVRDYEPFIRRAVRLQLTDARVRRVFDSMDVCQAVLISFFTRAAEGRFDLHGPNDLVNLLMTMARNKASKKVRDERAGGRDVARLAAEPIEEREPAEEKATPSVIASVRELVGKAKELMSPDEWRLLELRNQGHDWAEIAAACGGTPEGLRKRLERGLSLVRERLPLDEAAI